MKKQPTPLNLTSSQNDKKQLTQLLNTMTKLLQEKKKTDRINMIMLSLCLLCEVALIILLKFI